MKDKQPVAVHTAYEAIAHMTDESDRLAFAWAVREQESFWFAHDHAAVKSATNTWPDVDLRRMLRTYGLLRGKAATLLAGDGRKGSRNNTANRRTFATLAKEFSGQLKDGDAVHNSTTWQKFGHELAQAYGQPVDEKGWFLPSATAKIMWFHRPDIVPMYDRFAANAIGVEKESYICECYTLLATHKTAIADAKRVWGSAYPYDIRVLDKFLWVRGNDRGGAILKAFRAGCEALLGNQAE